MPISDNKLTPREIITALREGEHYTLISPYDRKTVIAQVSRIDPHYYVAGPLYAQMVPDVPLQEALQVEDTPAASVDWMNGTISAVGNGTASHGIFSCNGAEDAVLTLNGLFAEVSP